MKREITLAIITSMAGAILLYGIIAFLPEVETKPGDYQIELAGRDLGEYRIEIESGLAWAE